MKSSLLLPCLILLSLYSHIHSQAYHKIMDFEQTEVILDKNQQNFYFQFHTQKNEQNIISILNAPLGDFLSMASFTVYDIDPNSMPGIDPIWTSPDSDTEEIRDEFVIPPAKQDQVTSKSIIYIKITLKKELSTINFILFAFRELSWRNLVSGKPMIINRVYSQKRYNFQIPKNKLHYYYNFKASSEKVNMNIKLKDFSTISLCGSDESSLREWTKSCKVDSDKTEINYMIEITVEGGDEIHLLWKDILTIQVEEITSVAISPIKNNELLIFPNGDLTILKYIELSSTEVSAKLDTELIFMLDFNADSASKSLFEYRTMNIESDDITEGLIYDKLSAIQSLPPINLREISNKKYLNYFRYRIEGMASKAVKVILITLTQAITDPKMTLTLIKPLEWEFNEYGNVSANEFKVQPNSITMVKLSAFKLAPFILISNYSLQRIYKGPIVNEENSELQEPLIRQVYDRTTNPEDDSERANEIILEYINEKTIDILVKVILEIYIDQESVIYRYNQRDTPMKIMSKCTGERDEIDSEITIVDVVSEVSTKKQWLVAQTQYGTIQFHYKNTVKFDKTSTKSFLKGSNTDITLGLESLDTLFYIASMTCKQYLNAAGFIEIQEAAIEDETTKTIEGFKEFTTVLASEKKVVFKIDKVAMVKPNIKVDLIMTKTSNNNANTGGTVTITYGAKSIILSEETPAALINDLGNDDLAMKSSMNAAVSINFSQDNLFTYLPSKSGEKIETHLITTQRMLYKLTDPQVEKYTISFFTVDTTFNIPDLDKSYYSISKGIEGYIPLPANSLSTLINPINNPFLTNSHQLKQNEFYYLSLYFEEPTNGVNVVFSKELFTIGTPLAQGTKVIIDKLSTYSLEFNTDVSKTHLLLFGTFKEPSKTIMQIDFAAPLNNEKTFDISSGVSKFVRSLQRNIVSYNFVFQYFDHPNLRISYAYVTKEESERLTKLVDVKLSFEASPLKTNELFWIKPDEINASSIKKYRIFIIKDLTVTDAIENEYQLESQTNFEEVPGDKLNYIFNEEKYSNGTYAVNMLMIVDEAGVEFTIASQKIEIEVKHPLKPDDKYDYLWVWICLGVVVFVAVLLIILFIIRKIIQKKRQNMQIEGPLMDSDIFNNARE